MYFLQDAIGHPNPAQGVLVLTVIYAFCVIFSSVISGKLSDRDGQRKKYVIISSVIVAAAAGVMAVSSTFAMAIIAAVLLGIGFGAYLAVDFALLTQVLPQFVPLFEQSGAALPWATQLMISAGDAVSSYGLYALLLGLALLLFGMLIWTAMSLLHPHRDAPPEARPLRRLAHPVAGLVVLAAYAPAALWAATLPHGLVAVWVAMSAVFMGARGILLSWRARSERWIVTGVPVRR